jgi:archaemetzincin
LAETAQARERGRILIQPLGPLNARLSAAVKRELLARFTVPVKCLPAMPLPDYAWNRDRRQYCSSEILDTLISRAGQRPSREQGHILAIVDADIHARGVEFVLGEADVPARVAVIGLARLREGLAESQDRHSRFLRRVLTEAVHELGHTWGLGHCRNRYCAMFYSSSLQDTDCKGSGLCPACRSRLHGTRRGSAADR